MRIHPENAAAGPRVLAGRYQLGRPIGRGAFGVVYEATDQSTGRALAIKVLTAVDPEQEGRFRREVDALRALRHAHIVEVVDVGQAEGPGQVFLAMELLRGKTLYALCKEAPLAPVRAVRLIVQLLTALERAHALGIIHRDLKPGNLFVVGTGSDETLKVLDYGLARAVDAPSLTKTGDILGTPAYMAPEQARGQRVDERTDLFAAGACLYAALAGRPPIEGASPVQQVVRAMAGGATPLREVAPGTPPKLAALVERAMAPEPSVRFGAAREMREALDGWLVAQQPAKSRLGRAALAAVLALAAAAGGYFVVARLSKKEVDHRVTTSPELMATGATSESYVAPLAPASASASLALPRTVPPSGAAPAASFTPCTRNDQCGELEKCYPGGCSCVTGALRCGNRCRTPGTSRADCGCGDVCKEDHHCTGATPWQRCAPCAPGERTCGGESCVNLSMSPWHCGACGHPCGAGEHCTQGMCFKSVWVGERCGLPSECVGTSECVAGVCACPEGTRRCGKYCRNKALGCSE
ncbi:MAG: protein kinase [Polyangiaceae bacterium]|nr:protein kinase [Polyangiaceae bacterium]